MPETTPIKPGFKTTEFWMTVVTAVVSLLIASDVIPSNSGWSQLVALASAALAAMGYSTSRAVAKLAAVGG